MLAHPQRTLNLFTNQHTSEHTGQEIGPDTGTDRNTDQKGAATATARTGLPGASTKAVLYLHLTAADLATELGGAAAGGCVERLGSATLDLLGDWLRRVDGITIRPVLDPNSCPAVDAHDPPPTTRELVILRDTHCVFPGGTIDARTCDQDHIDAYQENGPPGQTHPDNLACLCRRHHRAKTFAGWTYHRTPTGRYRWTSPHGHTYLT